MQKKVLIEEWLPVRELGAESKRESAPIPGQFPKLKTLHVWWARRPITASAGVVLASLMPPWSEELAAAFPGVKELSSWDHYRSWFLRLCGIWGDPIAAQAELALIELKVMPRRKDVYGYRPAFKNSVGRDSISLLRKVLERHWGSLPLVADTTAGGGSIPFVASRLGLPVRANDLNPVAAGVLVAGVEIPATFGSSILADFAEYGPRLVRRVADQMREYFPAAPGEDVAATFLFANSVRCPRTGNWTPLVKQRWLNKENGSEAAVRFVTRDPSGQLLSSPQIEIAEGADIDFDASVGTVKGGVGTSIYDDLAIPADYITAEAQSGRMSQILIAVATKTEVPTGRGRAKTVRGFRAPTDADLDALARAEEVLAKKLPEWEANDVIPDEAIPEGDKTAEPLRKGMRRWRDMFTPRQLLVHGTFVEEFRKLVPEVRAEIADREHADAVLFELGLMVGKAVNWDSRMSSWDVSRQKMRSVFDRHDFAFKWDFAEFQGADELYPWCLSQLHGAYGGIAELLDATGKGEVGDAAEKLPRSVTISHGNAADLKEVEDGSVTLLCMDPPYHDNVMYAELSDYFYVWEKRTCGFVRPELYDSELTDKDEEAVANKARFKDFGRKAKELAKVDYERKMAAIFAETRRVLRDDGVFTIMFTHKATDAWSALGKAIIEAGFVVETSWPVRTESAFSLHQVDQAAAESTIMLACRKRSASGASGQSIQQVKVDIQRAVAESLARCEETGITGVDQLLSSYGPALSVVSSRWPVYGNEVDEQGNANLIGVDEVINIAAEEVTRIQRQRLFKGDNTFDPVTDFVLLAWQTFRSRVVPFDDARKLAFSLGQLNLETLEAEKIISVAKGEVTLLEPAKRIAAGSHRQLRLDGVDPNAPLIDALHAAMVLFDSDGMAVAKDFLESTGLAQNQAFRAVAQAALDAMPRAKTAKGTYQLPEVGALTEIGHSLDLEVPADPVFVLPKPKSVQGTFDDTDEDQEDDSEDWDDPDEA
ncbi:MAG: DUF1156 domain-containing protein [Actinomycetota bacterium]|nr:DUF1156 domain-containing protein [Actinomycetota bacterium]